MNTNTTNSIAAHASKKSASSTFHSEKTIPKGYRLTDVGVIPEDWEVKRLGEVASTSSGTTPSRGLAQRYFSGGSINWVKTLDLNNSEIHSTDELVTHIALDETSLKIYPIGTVLIAMYGGFNQIGRTGILTIPACINQAITAVQCQNILNSKYLIYLLNFKVQHWKSVASSSRKDPNINSQDIRNFALALPPLPEQQAIAAALSDVDALIAGLEALIAKKRHIKQGAMQELLTGQRRLDGFSGDWEVKRLGEVGICLRGVSYKGDSDLFTHDTPNTKRLLRSNNIQNANVVINEVQFVNCIRVSPDQVLKQNDILICMANGSKELVGKAGRFKSNDGYEYTFGAFMGCFRSFENLENDSGFIFYLFQTTKYRDFISNFLAGSSINNLKPSSIESLIFAIPPLPEQEAIARILSDMDNDIATLETRLDKTRALKQGMMQELLTGRVRLHQSITTA